MVQELMNPHDEPGQENKILLHELTENTVMKETHNLNCYVFYERCKLICETRDAILRKQGMMWGIIEVVKEKMETVRLQIMQHSIVG